MILPSNHTFCYDVNCYGDIGRNGYEDTVVDNIKDSFELSPDYKEIYIVHDSSEEQEFLHDIDMSNSYGLSTYKCWMFEGNEDRKTTGRKYIQMYPYEVPILRKGDYICLDYHLRGKKSTWLVTALDSQAIYEQIGSIQQCTNELRFYNEFGRLIKIPCVFNDDMNSEKNISLANMKYINGIITLYVQMNKDSEQIHPNQRFLFGKPGNWTAFRVVSVGVNNFMNEVFWDNETSHLMELTIEASYVNELTDDLVLGIADAVKFSIVVDVDNISNIVGATIPVKATVYKGGEPTDLKVVWESSDEDIATVDENGLVTLVADGKTTIKASMENNPDCIAEIPVEVVSSLPAVDEVVIEPSKDKSFGILQGSTQEFTCYLYKDGEKQTDTFEFIVDTEIPKNKFVFTKIDGNRFSVKNIKMDNDGTVNVVCLQDGTVPNPALGWIEIKLKGAW